MIKIIIIKVIFDYLCLNIDYDIFIIDKKYFYKIISNCKLKIEIVKTSIKIRNIETSMVNLNESIKLSMNIFDFRNDKSVVTRISKIFHIVNNLSIKILIEMNIIDSKQMKIDFKTLIIESCQNVLIELFAIKNQTRNYVYEKNYNFCVYKSIYLRNNQKKV